MMNGGQPIDPGLVQALGQISSSQEDQANLQKQLAMAQSMRAPQQPANQMAGRVVVRQSPAAALTNTAQNMLSGYEQTQALKAMQNQASMLRDARGRIISRLQAEYDKQNNPDNLHPDTSAQLDQELGMGDGNMSPDVPQQMPGQQQ